jgi:hypothetical protein
MTDRARSSRLVERHTAMVRPTSWRTFERDLRARRATGNAPLTIVTIGVDAYAEWCVAAGWDPADRPAARQLTLTSSRERARAGDGRPNATSRAGARAGASDPSTLTRRCASVCRRQSSDAGLGQSGK